MKTLKYVRKIAVNRRNNGKEYGILNLPKDIFDLFREKDYSNVIIEWNKASNQLTVLPVIMGG
jgi:hypothetical protein